MRYSERLPREVSIGCLPAAVFAVLATFPATFLILMSECLEPDGGLGACPGDTALMLKMLGVVVCLSVFITWATNRMAIAAGSRGLAKVWGLLGGFALSASLLAMLARLWAPGILL